MGSLSDPDHSSKLTNGDHRDDGDDVDQEEEEDEELTGESWPHGSGHGSWQATETGVKGRIGQLHNCSQMSDVGILASDENWWFGDTVKDFTVSHLRMKVTQTDYNGFYIEIFFS